MRVTSADSATAAELYLDLLKKCLTGNIGDESYRVIDRIATAGWQRAVYTPIWAVLNRLNLHIVRQSSPEIRADGRDWPVGAETMVGIERLSNLQACIADVIRRQVPGDLVETGAWRGGASIFMRGVLKAHQDKDRVVWVADSFQGLPKPDAQRYPADRADRHHAASNLAVSLDEVKANFAKYGLLDEQVRFLPGWFKDTLPKAAVDSIAVLRLDGDMYESTMVALQSLYPKLSVGGYAIIDDYWNDRLRSKLAVDDFRAKENISEPIEQIDWTGAFWRRVS